MGVLNGAAPHTPDEREIERLWRGLRGDMMKRGTDIHTAEDVAQEAWLRAVCSPPQEASRLGGWLHVVAKRLLRQTRATNAHRIRRELVAARPDVEPSQDDGAPEILRYVDELPEKYRSVIRLCLLEDRDADELGAMLGVSPETVRTRLKRGLARLRARVGPPLDRRRFSVLLVWLRRHLRVRGLETSVLRRAAAASAVLLACFTTWLSWSAARPWEHRSIAGETAISPPGPAALLATAVERQPRGSAQGAPSPEAAATGRSRLVGIVRTPSGNALPGALVHAALATDLDGETTTVADAEGRYEIAVEGRDLVWATHHDWCSSMLCYVPSVADPARRDLFVSSTRGRAIVLVRDADLSPVGAARVSVNALDRFDQMDGARGIVEIAPPPPSWTTDQEGRVELQLPLRSRIELLVLADRLAWYGEARPPGPGRELTITLPRAASIRGTCVDGAGSPSWKARIEVLQLGGLVRRETLSEHDGTFRIGGLAPGPFVLRAGEDPRLGWLSARHEGVLEAGASLQLPLVLGESATIHGRVLMSGVPTAGVRVSLLLQLAHASEGNAQRHAITDEHGRFAFVGCADVPYQKVRAHLPSGDGVAAEERVRPGRGEVVLHLVEHGQALTAPVELEFHGPELPSLVELRGEPTFSVSLRPESLPGRFRSAPVRECDFGVLAWTPELGTWEVGRILHDPTHLRVHELPVPQPGTFTLELSLPGDISRGAVEVAVRTYSINLHGLGALAQPRSLHTVPWDPAKGTYACLLPPGEYPLVVEGPGLAALCETITIRAGEETRLRRTALEGIETRILFRSPRPLDPGEELHLDAFTAAGPNRIELKSRDQRLTAQGFLFTARLPIDTDEMHALSSGEFTNGVTLEGRRTIAPGELEPASVTVELEFELAPTSR